MRHQVDILDRLSNGILLFLLHNFFPGKQQFVYFDTFNSKIIIRTYFAKKNLTPHTNLYEINFYHQKDTLGLVTAFQGDF